MIEQQRIEKKNIKAKEIKAKEMKVKKGTDKKMRDKKIEREEGNQVAEVVKISVRNLVEFILSSGDIDRRKGGMRDTDAMQEGTRIHRKIQRRMGAEYQAEVSLKQEIEMYQNGEEFTLCVEGRADGILPKNKNQPIDIIDEIKGMYLDVFRLEKPFLLHRAQVMCYAYMYGCVRNRKEMGIRLTYCNMETEEIRYFEETLSMEELQQWFQELIEEYGKWAGWQIAWRKERNASIQKIMFPFPYREGQKKLVSDVYRTILRKKKLYLEAPTGVGKTISTIFPSVKGMGEGLTNKIFYLTAKTITRTVAEETYQLLFQQQLQMKVVTITAKEKICTMEQIECNPDDCSYAKGHFDRINDAVFDLLQQETMIDREVILFYAEKHKVCPFELSLDVSIWADGLICDYNYVFDPNVALKRFFMNEKKSDYVFLVDEAHNLVDRAREMYSAVLIKERFLQVRKIILPFSRKLAGKLNTCNRDLLQLKRECEEFEVVAQIGEFAIHLLSLSGVCEEFLQEFTSFEKREEVLALYLDIRHFLNITERMDEKYRIYTEYNKQREFRIKLQCMDPSVNLKHCLEKGRSAIFFSATLLPVTYYKESLAGEQEDYAIYAKSPFSKEQRLIMIAQDVSSKYSRRTKAEYEKMIEYLQEFIGAKQGNYLFFFPSYQMLEEIYQMVLGEDKEIWQDATLIVQKNNMTELEKEQFLEEFQPGEEKTKIGFCVMGGIFSEGIDLKAERLIGVAIVGTGLPLVCNERELFKAYYDEQKKDGFSYAYLYQGMSKVMQSAGRVIRTVEDMGAILLLDERFYQRQYQELFPREWYPYEMVNRKNIASVLQNFWNQV